MAGVFSPRLTTIRDENGTDMTPLKKAAIAAAGILTTLVTVVLPTSTASAASPTGTHTITQPDNWGNG